MSYVKYYRFIFSSKLEKGNASSHIYLKRLITSGTFYRNIEALLLFSGRDDKTVYNNAKGKGDQSFKLPPLGMGKLFQISVEVFNANKNLEEFTRQIKSLISPCYTIIVYSSDICFSGFLFMS